MSEVNAIVKLFLLDKPFLILKTIYNTNGPIYSAMLSKRVDCSYAYIVKLVKRMNKLGITHFEESKHKKTIRLTNKGVRVVKALLEIASV